MSSLVPTLTILCHPPTPTPHSQLDCYQFCELASGGLLVHFYLFSLSFPTPGTFVTTSTPNREAGDLVFNYNSLAI